MRGIFGDAGLFDDPVFDDEEQEPAVVNEGCIPGWSVLVRGSKKEIGACLTPETAQRLAVEHSAEVWGYGKTANERFPEWGQAALLAYGESGRLVKTDEWPL